MTGRDFLITLDKVVNAIFGGDYEETISSRWGRAIRKDKCVLCKLFCKLFDLIDPGHCEDSIEDDPDEP